MGMFQHAMFDYHKVYMLSIAFSKPIRVIRGWLTINPNQQWWPVFCRWFCLVKSHYWVDTLDSLKIVPETDRSSCPHEKLLQSQGTIYDSLLNPHSWCLKSHQISTSEGSSSFWGLGSVGYWYYWYHETHVGNAKLLPRWLASRGWDRAIFFTGCLWP